MFMDFQDFYGLKVELIEGRKVFYFIDQKSTNLLQNKEI